MRKLLIILPVIFLIGCSLTPRKNIQSIATKELSALSEVTKAGTLLLYAEDYKSQTKADFSKADLRVVLLSLQNTSSSETYQINTHDIHGIGVFENVRKQIDYDEAIDLMGSSAELLESANDAKAVKVLRNVTVGAMVGGIAVGGIIGYDLISFVVASATGAVIGGSYGFIEGIKGNDPFSETNAMGVIAIEIISGKLSDIITVPPESKISGILLLSKDVRTITAKIKGTIYHIDIH
jgi:hypothetical protein